MATPLAGVTAAGEVPRGFEALRVPTAAEVSAAVDQLQPGAQPASVSRPVLVLDLETSGLGSTIVPFIAVAAWHDGARVVLDQWTLHDPMAERDFLAAFFTCLDAEVHPGTRLLSYNGSSFDLPRLRARARRLHLAWDSDPRATAPALAAAHLDLVLPARRVLKHSLPNCRLSTMESSLLGLTRRGDMSGMEIADLWSRMVATPGLADALAGGVDAEAKADALDPFLREDIAAAQRHNRADVWALFSVATTLADRVAAPQSVAEAVGVARHRRQSGLDAQALDALAPFLVDAQPRRTVRGARAADGVGWIDAAMLAADIHRATGRHDDASTLWRRVCDLAPGHVAAHEALAKHLEHRARRPDLALAVARASLAPCDKRLARLEKKAQARLAKQS
ncbi:MAG: ribonuclease H-like domain-containing protein [Myxococcota bacterium]